MFKYIKTKVYTNSIVQLVSVLHNSQYSYKVREKKKLENYILKNTK